MGKRAKNQADARRELEVAAAAKTMSDEAKAKRLRTKQRRAAAAKASRGVLWRYRAQLTPLYVLAGLWLAGTALDGQPVGRALILGLLGAGIVLFRLRNRLDRGKEWGYALSCCTATVLWLVGCATVGPDSMDLPGVMAWGAAALLWWRNHRVRPVDPVTSTSLELWWDEANLFPGSCLENVHPVDDGNGQTAEIVLRPGSGTTTTVLQKAETIASAREASLANTIIEPTRNRQANRAQLTVLKTSQVDSVHPWPGPGLDLTTGLAPVGPYADRGIGYAQWWRPGSGPKHWLVAGCTDGGKSRFLDWMLVESRNSGLVASFIADPQGGQSLPAWRDHAHGFADDYGDILEMLRELEAEMDARSRYFARMEWVDNVGRTWVGKEDFDPTPEFPIIEFTIDEAQDMMMGTDPPALPRLVRFARKGRKAGCRLVLATHVPSIDQLGGSMTLRAQVVAGNVISLRTAENTTKNMVLPPSFPVNPFDIPSETPDGDSSAGTMYLYGPRARPVLLRNHYVGKERTRQEAADTPKIPLRWLSVTPATVKVPSDVPVITTATAPDPEQADAHQATCRDAILALPWGQHPEQTRAQIHDGIRTDGCDVGLSAVQKALGKLIEDGAAERAGQGTYRLTGHNHERKDGSSASIHPARAV